MTTPTPVSGARYDPLMTLPTTMATATVAERQALGKDARKRRPRTELGVFVPAPDRPDPVRLLAQQEVSRVQELLPLRHTRMAASTFAFYRGGATIMANDLGTLPHSGLVTQLCGDAHLSNFGMFGAPDRSLVFDINDFDETHPGPFEWDVLRLAASFVLAGRDVGLAASVQEGAALDVGRAYREQMAEYAAKADLDIWYDRVSVDVIRAWAEQEGFKAQEGQIAKRAAKARSRNAWSAIEKMTAVVDGQRRFLDLPPLLMPVDTSGAVGEIIEGLLVQYRTTLPHDRQQLLLRYHPIDMAHKVVGVGSVGMLAFVVLMQGRDESDLIVLQAKQAVASVLEPYTSPPAYPLAGERVVAGQQLMQAASDIFLGWIRGPGGRDYYLRQLRDMKYSIDPSTFTPRLLQGYAMLCGRTLARAHARGGDAVAIASYLGTSDKFDVAVRDFSLSYAQQVEADYAAYQAAIADGRVSLGDQAEESSYALRLDPSTGVTVSVRSPAASAPGPASS
jgi:uncharacterized protein (DUF2252 family)